MLTACVTGHRRLGDPEQVRHVLAAALDRALTEGYTVWYVGMALGADQMAAELLLGKARRVVAVIPCDDYDRLWPASVRRRYRCLLARADEVVVYPGGPYAPWKPHARNRWMVDRSGLVVAVWDGRRTGGTYGTVGYARARGVPVRVVWPGKQS
ncbi:MAG: SLOG family protein [Bacillota bacterium]